MKRNGQIIKASHEPIINLDEFEQIQSILGNGGYKKRVFAFNGIMRCKHCGRAVVASHYRGHLKRYSYVYYSCGNNKCPTVKRKSIKEEKMETKADNTLNDVTWPEWFKGILKEEVRIYLKEELGDYEDNLTRKTNALVGVQKRRSNLLDMKLDDSIDASAFKQKQEELSGEIKDLEDSIKSTKARLDRVWENVDRVSDFIINSEQTYKLGDPLKKREILGSLGVDYVFDNGNVDIIVNPLLPWKMRALKNEKSGSEISQIATFSSSNSFWLGMRDSNPRMPAPKAGALPLGESPILSATSELRYQIRTYLSTHTATHHRT